MTFTSTVVASVQQISVLVDAIDERDRAKILKTLASQREWSDHSPVAPVVIPVGMTRTDEFDLVARCDLGLCYLGGAPDGTTRTERQLQVLATERRLLALRAASRPCAVGISDSLWRAVVRGSSGESDPTCAEYDAVSVALATDIIGVQRRARVVPWQWVWHIDTPKALTDMVYRFIRGVEAARIDIEGSRIVRAVNSSARWRVHVTNVGAIRWSEVALTTNAPTARVRSRSVIQVPPLAPQTTATFDIEVSSSVSEHHTVELDLSIVGGRSLVAATAAGHPVRLTLIV